MAVASPRRGTVIDIWLPQVDRHVTISVQTADASPAAGNDNRASGIRRLLCRIEAQNSPVLSLTQNTLAVFKVEFGVAQFRAKDGNVVRCLNAEPDA